MPASRRLCMQRRRASVPGADRDLWRSASLFSRGLLIGDNDASELIHAHPGGTIRSLCERDRLCRSSRAQVRIPTILHQRSLTPALSDDPATLGSIRRIEHGAHALTKLRLECIALRANELDEAREVAEQRRTVHALMPPP